MKKLFILFIGLAFVTFGCKKDQQPSQNNQLVDVSFSGKAMSKNIGGAKAGDSCFSDQADWAVINIDGTSYTVDVYYIDGEPYTKSIKLAPGTYHVTDFELYSDHNTPDPSDDGVIAATPADGSDYASYVTDGVPIEFTVGSFVKTQVPVEVLCFESYQYQEFGFFWYTYDQVVVRTQCFFGDFCVKHPDDYAGSLYAQQSGGLQLDMPAIFQIEVKRNGVPFKVVNNEEWLGEGQPLCVDYPDVLDSTDQYEFILSVLVKVGNNFEYKPFHTWTFADDGMIPAGDDGVVDFVLGNCVQSNADFTFAPYMNLPETCTYTVGTTYAPGTAGGYIDAILSDIPAGYDLYNGTWPSYCFDRNVDIYIGQSYTMDVYSSLYPENMPSYLANNDWSRANWIMNHLDYYSGYTWADIQGAMWLLDVPAWDGTAQAGMPALNTLAFAQQMHDDAVAALGANDVYAPPPGGWAAVVFGHDTEPIVQTVFVVVDP
jgi:hypothetical protein